MTLIEAVRKVKQDSTFVYLRTRKEQTPDEATQYDVKEAFTGNKKGWTLLDLTTAHAIATVYDHISEGNQKHLLKLPLGKAVNVVWSVLEKTQGR